ncbi:MAG: hypothetical protein AB1598_03490 [Thermodesulfobacteriota bacterium]
MKAEIKSFIVPVLLSGVWGVIAFLGGYAVFNMFSPGRAFFYPILLAGVVFASTFSKFENGSVVSGSRAAVTGFASGFIYLLVSPLFPLLASILAGACLGGGLSAGSRRFGGFLDGVISTLKGMIILPLVIVSGEFLSVLALIYTNSVLLCCFIWGAWLGLGVCLIRFPVFGKGGKRDELRMIPGLEEFREESREIERDLREFNEGIG